MFENLSDFFTDFAIIITHTKTNMCFKGILTAPCKDLNFYENNLQSQVFSLLAPTNHSCMVELQDRLLIAKHSYQVLHQVNNGTGLSTLMLERLD